jgi:hypothetical protein
MTAEMQWRAGVAMLFVIGACVSASACIEEQASDIQVVQSALIQAPGCGQVATNSACVCTDPFFNGTCTNLTNTTRFYMDLRPFSMNDNISSVWIGPDAKARFCGDLGMGGFCVSQSGGPPSGYVNSDLGNGCDLCHCGDEGCNWCCLNNLITSIRVDNLTDNCQSPGSNQLSLFTDINFGGDCVVLPVGQYPNPWANPTSGQTGGGFGLADNTASSLKSGPGPFLVKSIYADPNFGGAVYSVFGGTSVSNLGTVGLDNLTSSVNVR